jgi:phenylacetaldoxime dehydratase/aldoxime dehydratase
MAKLTPPDWKPPYPSYVSDIKDALTMALIAVQGPAEAEATAAFATLSGLLDGADGLLHSEQGAFVDGREHHNSVAISYWQSPDAFARWRADPAATRFVETDRTDDLGVWIEFLTCPRDRFEISNSTHRMNWGVSRHHHSREDPIHAYYGAMRDRIAAAEDGGLAGTVGRLNRERTDDTRGRHLTVDLPGNLCFIRTIQGWSDCSETERAYFLENTYPTYRKGVAFLQTHPLETNCIDARLVRDAAPGPTLPHTETLAWFLSLNDLENWVWNHPTHAVIFNAMFEHAKRFNFEIDVLLGHEVLVPPADGVRVEYHNCHNATGFLRFFEGKAL